MLDSIKTLLDIPTEDTGRDAVINEIISITSARLKTLLGGIEPPESMEYIVKEVTLARYNRLGSEGLSSHSVEGESMAFADNDFSLYANDIQAFLDTQAEATRGRLRFI